MLPGCYDIVVRQGSTFDLAVIFYEDEARTQLTNITGWTARLQARLLADDSIVKSSDNTVQIDWTTANGRITVNTAASKMSFNLSASDSAKLPVLSREKAIYDFEVVRADGTVKSYLHGSFSVQKETTR